MSPFKVSLFKAGLLKGAVARVAVAASLMAAAILVAGSRAEASTLYFDLTGDYNLSWQMDSVPTPTGSSPSDSHVFFSGIPGIDPLLLVFYASTNSGGIRVSDQPDSFVNSPSALFDLAGDQVFSGLLTEPHFAPGTYTFTHDFITGASTISPTTLVISASPVATTPIPAALPLFASALAGLGFAGWRRRSRAHAA